MTLLHVLEDFEAQADPLLRRLEFGDKTIVPLPELGLLYCFYWSIPARYLRCCRFFFIVSGTDAAYG